jgi:hypothetical protein
MRGNSHVRFLGGSGTARCCSYPIKKTIEEINLKVSHSGSNVLASQGVQSESKFQIQASAHAFRILSSGLYSDKIGAVLREIGCNAADSHIAAQIADRPIEIKLPTTLDAQFYIKDWGLGLDHEEITGLFTTYFSSNKGDTNEMTGAFGLGSKSPFSYTDSFSVTSAKGGVQRSYAAHLGSDGSPAISLLNEAAVDESWPNGLMVAFPVSPKDMAEFQKKAVTIFRWFRVKPRLVGATAIPDLDFGIVGSNFLLSQKGACSDIEEAQVLMGNVAYPLNATRLGNQSELITSLLNARIQIVMPIGSVMPTASREDLEYDDRTRENLSAVLTAAGKELAAIMYAKAMEPADSEWERHVRILDFRKSLPGGYSHSPTLIIDNMDVSAEERLKVRSLYGDTVKTFASWIGGDPAVRQMAGLSSGVQAALALMPAAFDRSNSYQVWIVSEVERRNSEVVTRRQVVRGMLRKGEGNVAAVEYKSKVEVIFSDTTHAYPRVRAYVQEEGDVAVMITPTYSDSAAGTRAYAEKVALELGGLSVKSTSSLTLPALIKAQRGKPATRRLALQEVYASTSSKYADFRKDQWTGVAGGSSEVKLTEVPETARYYLTAVVKGRRRPHTRYFVDVPEVGEKTLDCRDVDQIMIAYQAMRARGVPLPAIDGAVVLDTGEVAKLKIKENGFKPLLDSVVAAMLEKPVAKDLGRRLTNMPYLEFSNYRFLRDTGIIGLLIQAQKQREQFWKIWEPIAAEYPVLSAIAAQALAANDAQNAEAGTRVHLAKLLHRLPVKLKGAFMKQMSAEELAELVCKTYPMTRFFDAETFVQTATKHPTEAVTYLRQILIPADKLVQVSKELPEAIAV